ncbi:hypothetical protein SAMN05216232_3461 [Virgibacillus subterraneus]|uniref:DUF2007 domain-containing protein n=1 Tax=Virgibacillus subterraneus TaxID=621109 RepID=A0A1H9JAA0_9BACI|nr:hypothetical protein [Virgibacillus subterraneus]SEQ83708.1 hypothetical protein SAMN05216232_3461 [Virgibacillus subterraneus]
MQFFLNIIVYLFSSKKTLVYTTIKQQDYYKVVSLLESELIKYRVSITSNTNATVVGSYSTFGEVYKIYVKKGDQSKALKTMNKKSN